MYLNGCGESITEKTATGLTLTWDVFKLTS
mgnify:CR=1 FL=1